jgi:hypothetical protein
MVFGANKLDKVVEPWALKVIAEVESGIRRSVWRQTFHLFVGG